MQVNQDCVAVACELKTPIGRVYVAPNGLAMATWRIGERRAGAIVSTPDLGDAEIARAGLTGRVLPASSVANRLHG